MATTQATEQSQRRTALTVVVLAVAAVGLLAASGFVGALLLGPGTAARLGGQLQEVQTPSGNYVGRIVKDDGSWITLADPAVVSVQAAPDNTGNQVVVRSLTAEPFGLGGQILISHGQIGFVASVESDSQLAAAYRQALGK